MKYSQTLIASILLLSSALISFFAQILIINNYGNEFKTTYEYTIGLYSVFYTFAIIGIPSGIALTVSKNSAYPKNINIKIIVYFTLVMTLMFFWLPAYFGNSTGYLPLYAYLIISSFVDLRTAFYSSSERFIWPRTLHLSGSILILITVYVTAHFNVTVPIYLVIFAPLLPAAVYYSFDFQVFAEMRKLPEAPIKLVLSNIGSMYVFSLLSIVLTKMFPILMYGYVSSDELVGFFMSISLSSFFLTPINIISLQIISSQGDKINLRRLLPIIFSIIFIFLMLIRLFWIELGPLFKYTNIHDRAVFSTAFLFMSVVGLSTIVISTSLRFNSGKKIVLATELIFVFSVCIILLVFRQSGDFQGILYASLAAGALKLIVQTIGVKEK